MSPIHLLQLLHAQWSGPFGCLRTSIPADASAAAQADAQVSARAEGLRSDTAVGKLGPAALEAIRAPTVVISVRDDRYGTHASVRYTASRIAGAKFIGHEQGGHTWVWHDDEVHAEIAKWVMQAATP